MDSPAWLPPLNSHPNTITHVRIWESATPPPKYEQVAGRQFVIECKVDVDFFASTDVQRSSGIPGLSLKANKVSTDVKNHPDSLVRDVLQDDDLVPFPIEHSVWIDVHDRSVAHLSGEDELADKLLEFVLFVDGKPENADLDVVTVTMEINRAVFVPDREFRSWVSWFDEQRRVYPSFNREYFMAINKPRDTAAVYEEAAAVEVSRPNVRLAGEMESVVVKAGSEENQSSCTICLDEFCAGGACVVRLPCLHLFHEDCISTWLNENPACPSCRRLISFH